MMIIMLLFFVVVQLLRTTGGNRVRRDVASGGASRVICLDSVKKKTVMPNELPNNYKLDASQLMVSVTLI